MKNSLIAEMPEIIRAMTPILLAIIGGAIGITALLSPHISGDAAKMAAGMGLASTAITGAAGLAQSTKIEPKANTKVDPNTAQKEQKPHLPLSQQTLT